MNVFRRVSYSKLAEAKRVRDSKPARYIELTGTFNQAIAKFGEAVSPRADAAQAGRGRSGFGHKLQMGELRQM